MSDDQETVEEIIELQCTKLLFKMMFIQHS